MEWIVPTVFGIILGTALLGAAIELYRFLRRRYSAESAPIILVFPPTPGEGRDVPSRHSALEDPRHASPPSSSWTEAATPNGTAHRHESPRQEEADSGLSPPRELFSGRSSPAARPVFLGRVERSSIATPLPGSAGRPGPADEGPSGADAEPSEEDEPEADEDRAIVFDHADARTMRLLPGRLEVVKGEDSQSEIRFVDHPGPRAAVTFGRQKGAPLRHVHLHSPTVSRMHARMARQGSDWVIMNLSDTNPVVVNGVQLKASDGERTLQDGDKIELGEVVFRYHPR